ITLPFAGRLRTAVLQSVGAGCCAGATPSIQMRHMPGGGRYPTGMSGALPCARALAGAAIDSRAAAAAILTKRYIMFLQVARRGPRPRLGQGRCHGAASESRP